MKKSAASSSREGFVLVAVIWLAGLISVMALGFAAKVRVETLAAANTVQTAQAELAADGMARLMAWRLAKGDELPVDSTPQACRWRDGPLIETRVQDQAGLADLNAMPQAFFPLLFRAAGADDATANRLADAIADFRDPDKLAQNGGDEAAAYAGLGYGPKNAPFETVEELDQLPGVTESIYRNVLPLLTVHAAQPGIDPLTAPQAMRRIFSQPATGNFTGPLAAYTGAAQRRTFGIDVRVTLASGARFRRQAIYVMLRQPDRPFAAVAWMRGADWEDETRPAAAARACF